MKWSVAVLFAAAGCATLDAVPDPVRHPAGEVHARMNRGESVLLVCAYESRKCSGTHPAGSITLEEFEGRPPEATRNHEIVFHCG